MPNGSESDTNGVQLSWQWGRTPLPISAAPQVAYLLVEAQPLAPPTRAVPLNFCFVLDHSGSMQGVKIERMKAATHRVIEMLTADDIVSIVIFDDTVEVVLPATHATDKQALLATIDNIHEEGGTAMSLGMEAGRLELEKNLSANRLASMLILTDGQTWGDEEHCREIARTLAQRGVRITALGLGAEWNEQLLDDIADTTGGTSDYIAEPDAIDSFFQRTVKEVQGTAATEARLLLRLVRDVTPRAVYRAIPKIANLGHQPIGSNEVAVRLGDLSYGVGGSVIIELMVPSRAAGSFRIAQAELHYKPIGTTTGEQVIKQDVMLEFTASSAKAMYNATVMNLVEKVTAFKLQTRALEEAEIGNLSGATQKLRAAATRLLDMGELNLAAKTRAQADQLEQGAGLSTETRKELRYATRRLTQRLQDDEA
ncbi:MAG: VWA domain-containing protein [Chloroflexaceae bacterium]|nr:VWA domain-containing protein [Chloroflexaceae bacterium]NJL33040.1 VWA domain-containing protein [Chloroflexaceae bacterium]